MAIDRVMYRFDYAGALPEGAHDRIVIPDKPDLIRLYRKPSSQDPDIWFISAGFPRPERPFPKVKHCADFMNLVQIIDESNAVERHTARESRQGDDLLLFSRMLRQASEQPAEVCSWDRELSERYWYHNWAGISMGSFNPVPQYDCRSCGESSYAGDYERMINLTASHLGVTASNYGAEHEPAFRWGGNSWSAEQLDQMFKRAT